MQAIAETLFDVAYLIAVITIGILMIRGSKGERQFRLFGWMAVVLGAGDSFHLVPRVIALCTTGLENYTVPLGFGKLVTSVTMTVFYVLLYHFWRQRYHIRGRFSLTAAVYGLAGVRIALCMMPQNQWLSAEAPLSWGIYRNIPFALLYAILAMAGGVFYREFTKFNGFSAKTTLPVVHTHYFLLGMVFFLLLLVLEKNLSFTGEKTGRVLAVYHIGLNLTAVMLVVRGVTQVMGTNLPKGADAAISGMAGIGHILLGVSLVLLLLQIRRSVLVSQP